MPPFFSICIPVYNGEAFLETALRSVYSQTFQDWEIIAIDNASTDRTWDILQAHADGEKRLIIRRNERNLGMCGNINRCLELSSGAWVGILPADDFYFPEALEAIHKQVAVGGYGLWMHAHNAYHSPERNDLVQAFPAQRIWTMQELAELLYVKGNIFGELSCFFVERLTAMKVTGGFGRDRPQSDLIFWLEVCLRSPERLAVFSEMILTQTTVHLASESSRYVREQTVYREIFLVLQDMCGRGWRWQVRLVVALRAVVCLVKFFPKLPASARAACIRDVLHCILAIPPKR